MPLISSRDVIGPVQVTFCNSLLVEMHNTDRRLRLILMGDLVVRVQAPALGIDRYLTVPAGFTTNLASVPRVLWWVPGFAPMGRSERSATLHDWLYSVLCDLPWVTRSLADAILEAGLRADGECWLVRELVLAGVRLGGRSHWRTAA